MTRAVFSIIAVVLLGPMLPGTLLAQSDAPDLSLGDLARSLRKSKAPPAHTVIDNENLTQVMDDVESQRLNGHMLFSFDGIGKTFKVSSPDVTCSLSFNAQATALISDPYVPVSLPQEELAKLEGPATVEGGNLRVSVFNGTGWNLKEITVGLTILRRPQTSAAYYGSAKLVPASAADSIPAEKHSDITVLYHLKGAAAPFTTTVFRETLGNSMSPDQDWHWAIVEAKGFPPK
jgi:hypothetical protein